MLVSMTDNYVCKKESGREMPQQIACVVEEWGWLYLLWLGFLDPLQVTNWREERDKEARKSLGGKSVISAGWSIIDERAKWFPGAGLRCRRTASRTSNNRVAEAKEIGVICQASPSHLPAAYLIPRQTSDIKPSQYSIPSHHPSYSHNPANPDPRRHLRILLKIALVLDIKLLS